MESQASEYVVRAAEALDLPAVADIYNHVVLNSTYTFDVEPWTTETQRLWLDEHQHPYAVVVVERAGEVVGWGSLSPFRSKPAYRFTTEDSVYVRTDLRGTGIGALLLERLKELAAENGFRSVIARITGDNPASIQLHRRLGFREVGVERDAGYKFEQWIDVVTMQWMVAQ